MANAIDLTLASTVAGDLGVTADATIDRLVTAASRAIARYCDRTFEKGTAIVEYPPGYRRPLLALTRTPIISIASIVELGATVDPSVYEVYSADAGLVLRKDGVWALTARAGGRISETVDQHLSEIGVNGITVTYDGGYVTPGQKALNGALTVTLPEDIQEAANITASQLYRSRGIDALVQSESLGDWSVAYFERKASGQDVIPGIAKALLAPYVRVSV